MNFRHMKRRCAGCERTGLKMNKEHVYPEWLIERTGTRRTGITWWASRRRRIPASAATLPLCVECNRAFGDELERPVSRIFDDLEAKRGISDNEAELLVRWLWKIEGLFWVALHPSGDYSLKYTLRERVLLPLDAIRGHLAIALSLIEEIDPSHGDKPLGLDSRVAGLNAIFVSGVFSRIAIMVLLEDLARMVPENFSLHRLASTRDTLADVKRFHPKVGFRDDNEAVFVTKVASGALTAAHEIFTQKVHGGV